MKPPKLDVAIVATVRPEILRMTLQSFSNKLFDQFDCRAIINVDPVGEIKKYSQADVVNVCREYFGEVISRTPQTPSFAGAVQWCWQQVETEFFFQLEDDWILTRKIDGMKFMSVFANPMIVELMLNKYGGAKVPPLQWDPQLANQMHDEEFLILDQLCLNPAFFRSAYIKQIVDFMDVGQDPEEQWGHKKLNVAGYPEPIFLWHVAEHPLIIDSGTLWRKANRIHKQDGNGDSYWIKRQYTDPAHWRPFGAIDRKIQWQIYKRWWSFRYCRNEQ